MYISSFKFKKNKKGKETQSLLLDSNHAEACAQSYHFGKEACRCFLYKKI